MPKVGQHCAKVVSGCWGNAEFAGGVTASAKQIEWYIFKLSDPIYFRNYVSIMKGLGG